MSEQQRTGRKTIALNKRARFEYSIEERFEAGIALAFGANIGTCITALLAAIGKPREALMSITRPPVSRLQALRRAE